MASCLLHCRHGVPETGSDGQLPDATGPFEFNRGTKCGCGNGGGVSPAVGTGDGVLGQFTRRVGQEWRRVLFNPSQVLYDAADVG